MYIWLRSQKHPNFSRKHNELLYLQYKLNFQSIKVINALSRPYIVLPYKAYPKYFSGTFLKKYLMILQVQKTELLLKPLTRQKTYKLLKYEVGEVQLRKVQLILHYHIICYFDFISWACLLN